MAIASSTTQTAPRRLCLVLSPIRGPEPTALLRGLQQRGGLVLMVHDAPSVMLNLAQQRMVSPPGGTSALIVDDPSVWRVLPELLAAVHRYFPSVVCWSHTRSQGRPELRKLDAPTSAPPTLTPARSAAPPPTPASLHGRAETPADGRDVVTNPAWPTDLDPAEPLVTRQEMEMLLAPRAQDKDKPNDRNHRGASS